MIILLLLTFLAITTLSSPIDVNPSGVEIASGNLIEGVNSPDSILEVKKGNKNADLFWKLITASKIL